MGAKNGLIEDFNVVQFGGDLMSPSLPELVPQLVAWSRLPVAVHLFDLRSVGCVDAAAARALRLFSESLSGRATIMSINAAPPLRESLAAHKLDEVLAPSESLSAAIKKRGPRLDSSMSKEFLLPFQNGLCSVLLKAAQIQVRLGRPYAKRELTILDEHWAAWLELDLGPYVGFFGFLSNQDSLNYLHQSMLGEPGTQDAVLDCAMEILNMTYGAAKRELADKKGFAPKRVLPTAGLGAAARAALSAHHFMAVEIPVVADNATLTMFLQLSVKP